MGQVHRIQQRNHELMHRRVETAAAKQHEEEQRLSRLHAIQEQVILIVCVYMYVYVCVYESILYMCLHRVHSTR